jgi:hypothetical protein
MPPDQTVTPAASTPAASTPAASTPAASTPAASTPAASTPAASTPAASTQSVAPEKYEFKTNGVLPEVLQSYSVAAKELNLSQDAAQKMLDTVVPVMQAQQAAQLNAVKAQWLNDSKTDKEFGGDAFEPNLAIAKKAIGAFASEGLTQMLNETGLGNHPEVIRFFYQVGKKISEDNLGSPTGQGASKQAPKTFAERMYPATT